MEAILALLHHRKMNDGGVFSAMENFLFCYYQFSVGVGVRGSIVITIEIGEVATGNIDSNSVSWQEGVGSRVESDFISHHFAGCHKFFLIDSITVTSSHHAERNINCLAIGMHVYQSNKKISVRSGGGGKKFDNRIAGDLESFG